MKKINNQFAPHGCIYTQVTFVHNSALPNLLEPGATAAMHTVVTQAQTTQDINEIST